MVLLAIVGGIGLIIIAVGLVFGYFAGVHMVNAVSIIDFISIAQTYARELGIAIALLIVGGLLLIIAIKRR